MPSRFHLPAFASTVLLCLASLVTMRTAAAQATFTVTTLTDPSLGTASNCTNQLQTRSLDSNCSLRDALAAAAAVNGLTGTQAITVSFAASLAAVGNPASITLGATALSLPAYTMVQGLTAGSGSTLTNLITLSGNAHEVFTTASAVTGSALSNLSLTNGAPALRNAGSITVTQCTFANNAYTSGAAIYNSGTVTVVASTFTGNAATSYGGAIYSTTDITPAPGNIPTTRNLSITASTFQGNSSEIDGGALYIGQRSVGMVDSSTFTGNRAKRDGAALYLNNGSYLSGVTNSILTGDTGGSECAGFGCDNAALGYTFVGSYPTGVSESGNITMTATLSTGQVITVTEPYGASSTAASLAAAFGGFIANKYYPTLTAQSFGTTLLIVPTSATLTSVVFQNPSKYFTITPITTSVLSGTGNVVSVGTAAANLTALGGYGGPTQTVLPLPGSAALCTTTPASAIGTDQRGLPRTTAFGSVLCQDSGAVQTNYALTFAQQPGNTTVNTVLAPSPSVQITESGQKLLQASAPVTLIDLSGSLTGSTTAKTDTAGLAAFPGLTVAKAQAQDMLTASLAVGANSVSATSSAFDVTLPPTASLGGNATFPLTAVSDSSSRVFTFTNTGTARITIAGLAVTAAPEWTQTNTCGLTLAAGASCAITVTFQPVVEGTRSGLLTLTSDASGYSQSVALTGTAALPTATLTGNTAFPDTVLGSASPAQSFTLRNTGTVPLAIGTITLSRDFTQTNGCGSSLVVGGSCTLAVVFAPTVVGARTAVLQVATNSSNNPLGLLLTATGVLPPAFTLVDNASGARSTAITVAAGSTGTGVLKLASLNGFVGNVALTCVGPGTAVAGVSCTVDSPMALAANGTATATVTITTTSRVVRAGLVALPQCGGRGYLLLLGMLCLASVALRRANRFARVGSLLLSLLALGLGLSGCGGTAATPATSTANPNGTAAGTYTYVVNASSGTLTASQLVTLTVQ